MPFKGNRIYLLLIVIFIVAIIIIGAAANSSPKKPEPTPPPPPITPTPTTVSITINTEIGVKQITITNLNTGTSIIRRQADLPFTFQAVNGDTIRFNVQTEAGYIFNAWIFQSQTFDNHNPLTLKVTGNLEMKPLCLQEA